MSKPVQATNAPADMQSYGARFRDLATRVPDGPALTLMEAAGEAHLTWQELLEQASQYAQLLADLGCVPGSRLAIRMPNGWIHPLVCIGAWRLGACVLPLSHQMPDTEYQAVLAAYGPDFLVDYSPGPQRPGTCTVLGPRELSEAGNLTPRDDLPDVIARPAVVIASGGSSGRPKLVADARPWGYRAADLDRMAATGFAYGRTVLIAGPLYHTSPFNWLHKGLLVGNHVVLLKKFDEELALDAIERHRVGYFPTVPTVMGRLLNSPTLASRDLSSLQALYHTGGPCPPSVKEAWIKLVGAEHVFESYGSTENLGPTRIRGDEWLRHRGSVGIPSVPTRILDEHGADCPLGVIGRIFQRPSSWPARTFSYLSQDVPTATPDGYVSVGDFGSLDADGYLFLAERRLDMIVTGGANVYPAEVEAVLTEHPAVADVVVVGMPDDTWGTAVHALVELVPDAIWDADDLSSFTRARLTPYKVPKHFTRVDRIPRSDAGKLHRQHIREELLARAAMSRTP